MWIKKAGSPGQFSQCLFSTELPVSSSYYHCPQSLQTEQQFYLKKFFWGVILTLPQHLYLCDVISMGYYTSMRYTFTALYSPVHTERTQVLKPISELTTREKMCV